MTDADLTDYSGSLTITGYQYRKRFTLGGNQLVLAAGANLEQCRIVGTRAGNQGQVRITGAGVQMTNCDIVGSAVGNVESMGIFSDNLSDVTLTSINMAGFTISWWLDSGQSGLPSVMDQCYSHSQLDGGGSHHDGFTRRGGTAPLTIRNTRIAMLTPSATGAFFTQSTWGDTIGNITVEDCYLEGLGYNVTLESTAQPLTFQRNRFRPTEWGVCTRTGTPTLNWSQNYLWANNPGNDYKGNVISTPT